MSIANPIPDPRHEPRPWRPPGVSVLNGYEVRPYSDWLEVAVRLVEGYIVEAWLRFTGSLELVEHWPGELKNG